MARKYPGLDFKGMHSAVPCKGKPVEATGKEIKPRWFCLGCKETFDGDSDHDACECLMSNSK